MAPQPADTIEVFYSYAHQDQDETLRDELVKHLANLERQKLITGWHDRKIAPGQKWEQQIDARLNTARIILLLISPDFMASEYCNDIEVRRAMERHEAGEARVIPIILRPCDWLDAPFSGLQALPKDGKPVTRWENQDQAFENIAQGIRGALKELQAVKGVEPEGGSSDPNLGCHLPPQMLDSAEVDFVPRRDADDQDLLEGVLKKLPPQGNKWRTTLWGLGGVGKTRLATEIVCKWKETHGGRVVWCDALRRVDYTLKSMLDEIIKQLTPPGAHASFPNIREAYVRARALVIESLTLIVLDDYEEITSNAQGHIKNWLKRVECVVLFVSREQVEHTHNIKLLKMKPEETEKLIKLWVRQTQDPDKFTEKIRRRISQTAEGSPLLVEWIVRQIDNAKTPTEQVFRDLRRGKGTAVQRVFDRSFNLPQIGDDGRATLLAVSLFKPSATRDALAEVAGFPGADERLEEAIGNLRRFGLIKADRENRRLLIDGSTLRQARSRLPTHKHGEDIWRRFINYFRNQITDRPETLTTEKSNILMAIQVAPCVRDWDTVVEFYDKTLVPLHSFRVWTKAIELSEKDAEERIKVDRQSTPIIIKIAHQDREKAREHYEGIESQIGEDKRWQRVVLSAAKFGLGVFAYEDGDHWLARELFQKAEELKKGFGDHFGAALASNNLGVAIATDAPEDWAAQARKKFEEALETFKRTNDNHEESICTAGDSAASGKRTSLLAKWLVAPWRKFLAALHIFRESGNTTKRGARFAKAAAQNLEWLERLERFRARK